jgi:tRNA (mo5U34)-methyltransferase
VFCFGTIYDLRHPLLALDRLSAVCDGDIYVESAVLDDYSPYRGGLGHGYPGGQMVAELYPTTEYGKNMTNWWVPTGQCLAAMVYAARFTEDLSFWKLEPTSLLQCRGYVHGRKPVRQAGK